MLQPDGRDARLGSDLGEACRRPVAEQEVAAPVRDVEVEAAVAVEVAGADAVAPRGRVDPRLARHVLELPAPEVAVEHVLVRDALAGGRELGGRDQVDVEASVAVVVDERDAASARLEDVVLRRSAAVGCASAAGRPPRRSTGDGARSASPSARGEAGPAPAPSPTRGRRRRAPSPSSGCSCPGGSGPARSRPRAGARARSSRARVGARVEARHGLGARGARRSRAARPSSARSSGASAWAPARASSRCAACSRARRRSSAGRLDLRGARSSSTASRRAERVAGERGRPRPEGGACEVARRRREEKPEGDESRRARRGCGSGWQRAFEHTHAHSGP